MQIELTPEMESTIALQLRSGRYASPLAVVADALRNMPSTATASDWPVPSGYADWNGFFAALDEDIAANGPIEWELDRDMRPAEERDLF